MKFVINVYGRRGDGDAPLYRRMQATLGDMRPDDDLLFTFIDMDETENLTDHDENLIGQLDDGDLQPPLITINDEIVAEGSWDTGPVVRWFGRH